LKTHYATALFKLEQPFIAAITLFLCCNLYPERFSRSAFVLRRTVFLCQTWSRVCPCRRLEMAAVMTLPNK